MCSCRHLLLLRQNGAVYLVRTDGKSVHAVEHGPVGASHPTSNDEAPATTWLHYFSKGDYIEIDVFQPSGGALNLNTPTLSLVRLPGAATNAF